MAWSVNVWGLSEGFADSLVAASDAIQSVEVLVVGLRQGVQVLLRRLDLGVSHALHDALEVGATGEQPARVRMPQVMDPQGEVDAARLDCWQPYARAKGVA